jgi:hypothetical protein
MKALYVHVGHVMTSYGSRDVFTNVYVYKCRVKWLNHYLFLVINCAQVGISAEAVVSGRELPVLPCSLIMKGIVYELNTFRSVITCGITFMNG